MPSASILYLGNKLDVLALLKNEITQLFTPPLCKPFIYFIYNLVIGGSIYVRFICLAFIVQAF